MISFPKFKPHLHAERVSGEGLMLLSERGHAVLRGRLVELVAPLIDGRRSADEIAQTLEGRLPAAEVFYALGQLEKKGYLTTRNGATPPPDEAFWHLQGIDPAAAADRLEETTISLTALGGVDASPLAAALRPLRIGVGDAGRIGVVVTDDYLRSGLQDYNREALRANRSWLLVKPVGSQIWLGPVVQPGRSACWECLAARLRANREVEMFLQEKNGRLDPVPIPLADLPATQAIAWNLAATEIARWVARGNSAGLEGKLLTLDTLCWKTQWHTVVRRPQCPACGNPDPTREPGIVLQSRKKTFTRDGGHRTVSPEETLRRHGHHVSRITGAVTTLDRSDVSRAGLVNVYWAGHNVATQQRSFEEIRSRLRSQSAGKGASDLQAKAGALCEALERHSGIYRGDEPRTKACRWRDLGGAGIHPNLVMGYSEKQYAERADWNAHKSPSYAVSEPFDEEEAIEWTPLWSLTRGQVRYLPTAFCYYGYPMTRRYCRPCSNGNAAGNTLEEAILQGFFELVERDAVAMWWYNRLRRPAVDLDSFKEPYLTQLRDCLRADQHRDLWVLDLTNDFQIPTFVALSRRQDRPSEEILLGFGAHFDARIALLRAVTELNQMLAWVWTDKDGRNLIQDNHGDSDTMDWLKTATVENQPYLNPADGPRRRCSDFRPASTDDLREDVRACQALVEREGMELLVLDQTRPDIGLPVVKVVVPGLRHFWPRYAPGRLYNAPVKLGWLPAPLPEEALNPIAVFI